MTLSKSLKLSLVRKIGVCSYFHHGNNYTHTNAWSKVVTPADIQLTVGSKQLKLATGSFARFADGCVVARYGDTAVMVTAVSSTKQREGINFLPLTVDFRQKASAAGRIPTNFLRRELGPSDNEILTSRLIDRSVRPLFPKGYVQDTQLVCNLLAVDGCHDPDVTAINAASAALAVSDIPWNGPVGAVRVGAIDDKIVINPTRLEQKQSILNIVITGCGNEKVAALEAGAERISPQLFIKGIKAGLAETDHIINHIKELQLKAGRQKRTILSDKETLSFDMQSTIQSLCSNQLREVFADSSHHKISRDEAVSAIKDNVVAHFMESYPTISSSMVIEEVYSTARKVFRDLILDDNVRCDGRLPSEIRPISCEVDLYPPLHGSAVFQRGQTQVLATVTFDSIESAAKLDDVSSVLMGIKEKNFFLHYEFPPYATNEIGRTVRKDRRELGHGALAERGLRPVLPDSFPFTIRLTAEVLESNGSSSMASACSGCLALMDAGVQIKEPVAGVAMGLVSRENPDTNNLETYKILTDLLGIEDYNGDMDFKLTGTESGVTGLQADIKLPGLPLIIVEEAIAEGMKAIKHILSVMEKTLPHPRENMKQNSPVVEILDVPAVKRARFLGAGGYNLKKLTAETGVTVSPVDENKYQVFAPNATAMEEAKVKIEELLTDDREPELDFGAIYTATIVEIRDYGVMVQLYPTMSPTLIHNSQLDQRKINHPSALNLNVGEEISVKYFGRDPASGQMRLSRKVLFGLVDPVVRNLRRKDDKS